MSLCTVWHLAVPCRATARAQLQQSQPQTAWAGWLLNLHPLCFSETQPSSSPSALLCPSTTLGAESHSARMWLPPKKEGERGQHQIGPNVAEGRTHISCSPVANAVPLWHGCPEGHQLQVHKAPSAVGACFLAAESRRAAQPSCIPNGSQEGDRGSSSAARISAALS